MEAVIKLLRSPSGCFARQAATFSVFAPLVAFFLGIFVHQQVHRGISLITIVRLLPMLLIISGLVFGIIALVATKRYGRKGIFGKALTGTCINGLLVLLMFVIIVWSLVYGHSLPTTPQGRLDRAIKELATAPTERNRFYALDDAAKQSFEVGKIEDAREYATELLTLAQKFKGDWNYGNAVQDGNLVLGRIALHEGRMEEAKQYLLEAGKSPGSPQMNSFGPNMSLAQDLLEKGERETVLQYFELCRKFWKMDYGKLDQWSREVKSGKIPDFGANLVY